MKFFLILFILLISEAANAKKFTFGDTESIGFLKTTSIVDEKGETLFLGYKTTQVNFFIPLYNKDNGYILGKISNNGRTYYPFDNKNKLEAWQQNGQLPKVLPMYHTNVLNSGIIIFIVLILLLLVIPSVYVYLKNKRSENFSKLFLTALLLISFGYLIYETIPDGAKKQRLISVIKQWNICALKLDSTCLRTYAPDAMIENLKNDYNTSFSEAIKQWEKYMLGNKIQITDKKLDEIFNIKKSKYFDNVWTATGNIILTLTHKNKQKKSNEKFFAISIDNGKSWKMSGGTGDKDIRDILTSAYPFVEDLKKIGDNK